MPDIGDVLLGRYELNELLGRGGFGRVFGGRDRVLGREIAVKLLDRPSPEDLERFSREARVVASLDNEHVVRVYEVGVDAGAPFLIMERLHGQPLSALRRASGGSLPISEAVDLVLDACEALSDAHAQGVVHRDIKPMNLFVTHRRDGSRILKVLDFGIAKCANAATLTGDQVTMGTLRYMAPEQIRDAKRAGVQADIWAIGVVLYELISGKLPFEARADSDYAALVLVATPTPLEQRAHVPPDLAAIVARCLDHEPARRWPSVAALAVALSNHASPRVSDRARRSLVVNDREFSPSAMLAPTTPAVAPHLGPLPRPTNSTLLITSIILAIGVALVVFAWRSSRASHHNEAASVQSASALAVDASIDSPPIAPTTVEAANASPTADASPAEVPLTSPIKSVKPQSPTPTSSRASDHAGHDVSPSIAPLPPDKARFVGACMSAAPSRLPLFLVAGGPPYLVCLNLFYLGDCDGVRARCSERSPADRVTCAAFLDEMQQLNGCP